MSRFEQIKQKMNEFKEQFSWQVFLAGLVLTVMFFLIFINSFKTHTAKIEILFTAKSETAALQSRQILNNLMELPKTLNFYENLLDNNSDVRDIAQGKSNLQRKEIWNSLVSTRKVEKNSSLFEISITTKRENDAKILAQKTVRNLFDTASAYYNVKNDVDLRVVDGPILETNLLSGSFWALVFAVIFGFLLAILLRYLISSSQKIFAGSRQIFAEKNWFDFSKKEPESSEEEKKYLESLYSSEQIEVPFEKPEISEKEDVKFEEIKELTKMIEPDKYPNFREMPKVSAGIKSSAPANLPIAEGYVFGQQSEEKKVVEKKEYSEPDQEKLKERLNRLLRGEM
ncbi:MAG TPA: hypothetical protein PLB52_01055 [Candidatus Moranbacteria bacterium]|nr:hypothetical protein [Candidatus Moranbacteria bacterium]